MRSRYPPDQGYHIRRYGQPRLSSRCGPLLWPLLWPLPPDLPREGQCLAVTRERVRVEALVMEEDVGGPAGSSGASRDARPGASSGRQESEAQRDDRNLAELLQELRVVSLGVQVLFGFLLGLPFTVKFERLSDQQRDLYLTSVTLSAVAAALLLGPVAYHRVVFRRGLKTGLVRFANAMATVGLAAVAAAILAAVALVVDYVAGTVPAALISALIAMLLVTLWFAVPVARRRERR